MTMDKTSVAHVSSILCCTEEEEYEIYADCTNCDFTDVPIEIVKGVTIVDALPTVPCPRCGCLTLIKQIEDKD